MAEIVLAIVVEEDVPAKLVELAGSEENVGAFISLLIQKLHANLALGQSPSVESAHASMEDLRARLEELDTKLTHVESRLDDRANLLRAKMNDVTEYLKNARGLIPNQQDGHS